MKHQSSGQITLSQAKDGSPLKVQSIGSETSPVSNDPTSPLTQHGYDICRPCVIDKLCITCKKEKATHGTHGFVYRCKDCHRRYNAGVAFAARLKKKKEIIAAGSEELMKTGWRICTVCIKQKRLSEFSTSLPKRRGKVNKICDKCLVTKYSKNKTPSEFNGGYLRRRAYAVNSGAKNRLRKDLNRKKGKFALTELPWICKPLDVLRLLEAAAYKCQYCNVEISTKTFQIDHAIPLSEEGAHAFDNLVCACDDCNRLKWNRTKEEFLLFLSEYGTRLHNLAQELLDKKPVD